MKRYSPCFLLGKAMGPGIDFPLVMNYFDTEMPNGTAYFYFLSGHNDVAYFSNSTFDDYETYEYNPWGVLLTQANKNNLLYTSREFDFDIGLQFNRMRYYSPNLGRFIEKDKIYLDSRNKCIYVSNNPNNYYDILGFSSDIECRGCYLVCICCTFYTDSGRRCKLIYCWIFIYISCQW